MSQPTPQGPNASVRPFTLDEPQFDMNSYLGRVQYYYYILNPR